MRYVWRTKSMESQEPTSVFHYTDDKDTGDSTMCGISVDGPRWIVWSSRPRTGKLCPRCAKLYTAPETMRIEGLVNALHEIHTYAHDRSQGPTVVDDLWIIRSMAEDALNNAP